MFGFGMQEVVVIGIVAILLFGKRLPEVARTWGKYYSEFRRSLADIQSQMDMSDIYSSRPASSSYTKSSRAASDDYDDYDEATAPKFEPPPSEPREEPA